MNRLFNTLILTAVILISALLLPVQAAALGNPEINISIPTFHTTINERLFDNAQAQYPLIVYNDITYFPLTWGWCQELGLAISWTEEKGLYIANYVAGNSQVVDSGYSNNKNALYTASVPSYPIVINTRGIDNLHEEYPLINFRGITYFPMTWRFIHDEFNWQISWDNTEGLFVNSGNYESPLYLIEAHNDYALLQSSETYYTEVKNEDGSTTFFYNGDRFIDYNLDYAANSLSITDENAKPAYNIAENYIDISRDITVDGTNLIYKGKILDNLSVLAGEKTEADEQSDEYFRVFAHKYSCGDSNVILTCIYYHAYIPAPYTPRVYRLFIERDGVITKIEKWPEFLPLTSAYQDGSGGLYLCSNYKYLGGRYSNSLGTIYHLYANNEIFCLNDKYEDYNNLQAIGMIDGVLYLKATWFPNVDEIHTEGVVSAVNDGFFTLNPDDSLTRIRSFVYGETFLTPSGKLYCILSWKKCIMDIETGELILPK